MAQTQKKQQDMGTGDVKKLLLQLMIPAVVAQVVNLLYNIVDRIYIGHIPGIGAAALTGVGLFTPILMLLNAFAMLIGSGGAPRTAIAMGQGDKKQAEKIVSNSFTMLLLFSVVLTIVFYAAAPTLLRLFGASDTTLPYALAYSRIYILGTICVLIVLGMNTFITAQGFAKISMLTTVIGAVINIVLDPILIFLFGLGVRGAAIATVLSQCVSAALTVLCLVKSDGMCHLDLRRLHFRMDKFLRIMQVGLPAGMQSVIFNISNVLIQSSVNSFGAVTVAGNTAAANIEGFVYISMNALYQTSISFTSQNLGAKNYHRIDQTLVRCMCIVTLIGLVLGNGAHLLGNHLLHIYSDDLEVISFGMQRLSVISVTYCLCGMMDVLAGTIRGLGYSMLPMIVSLIGACVFRIIWIFTVFRVQHTLFILYASYPISWILTILAHFVCYLIVRKKVFRPQET